MAYTFCAEGADGSWWYPLKLGDQTEWIAEWTQDINKAVKWEKVEDFDCLMNEYYVTKVVEV